MVRSRQQAVRELLVSRRKFVGGAAALAGLGLSGFEATAQQKSSGPRRGGMLNVSAYANPSSLDPYTGRSGADQTFLFAIYDTLVSFDPQLRPVPGLAKWSFPDPKTLVLDIFPGILFHDGTACDAEAVKANLDRGMTGQRSTVKTELIAIASVEVTGPLQVTLKLKNPDSNPSRLDPSTGTNGADQALLWPMFDTLIDYDFATLKPKPKLAESWEFRDPTTLVLNIRSGVKFHDGVALDAEAVKFNFVHMMTNPASAVKGEISTIKSVEVEGPQRVVLKLSQPDVSIVLAMTDRSGMMSSPKAIKERGADYDRNPVGAGQYVFQSWVDADRLTMTRNPNYWQKDQPALDGIEFRIIPDTNTGLRAVYAGECDLVYRISPQQITAIDRNKNVVKHVDSGLYTQQLFFNNSKPPMTNVKVRQAINYAIDRVAYTKAIAAGYGEPAYTSVPKSHWAYDEKAASYYHYDPDKARSLLKEADLENVELHAFHYSDQRSQQRMEILTANLTKAGFRLKYTTGSIPQVNKLFNDPEGGHFISSAWTGRADPSVILTSMFMQGGYYNKGDVPPTPELKQAVLDTLAFEDQAKRKEAFSRALRYERESALYAPLTFDPEVVVHNPKVKGFVPTLLGKPRFDGISLESKA